MSPSRTTRPQRVASVDHEVEVDGLASPGSFTASPAAADHRPDDEHRHVKPGRPSPLKLSSAILLCPEAVMALDGKSMRGRYEDAEWISLFKGIERTAKLRLTSIPPTLASTFVALAEEAPSSRIRDLFVRAIGHGDAAAREEIESMGPWAAMQGGLFGDLPAGTTHWTAHFVEIEAASKSADRFLGEKAYAQAADALAADPRLQVYLTDQALTMLRTASGEERALLARAAGALEVLLSSAARNDVTSHADRQSEESFEWLIEPGPDGQLNVGRAWVRRMVEKLGQGTLEGLIGLAQDPMKPNRTFVDLTTLKRWHSGKVFPSVNKLSPLLKSVLADRKRTEYDLELKRYGCAFGSAVRIHKCLGLVRLVDLKLRAAGHAPGMMEVLAHNSPDDWARMRYVFWLNHWQSRGLDEGWAGKQCPPITVT